MSDYVRGPMSELERKRFLKQGTVPNAIIPTDPLRNEALPPGEDTMVSHGQPLTAAIAVDTKPVGAIEHTDSDTIYHVGALTRIANASRREDGTDIPLGEALREACCHMEAQAQEIGELNAKIAAMTPPTPWENRE